jgi:hypothetical protein
MQKNTAKMRAAGANTVSSGQNCLSMIMHKNGSLLHRMHELLKKRKCHDGFCSVHHFCKIIVSKIHRCCCVRATFEKNTKRILPRPLIPV